MINLNIYIFISFKCDFYFNVNVVFIFIIYLFCDNLFIFYKKLNVIYRLKIQEAHISTLEFYHDSEGWKPYYCIRNNINEACFK